MKESTWKYLFIGLVALLLFGGGFYLGRSTIKQPKPEVIYVKGDSITVEKPFPVPVEVIKPADTANVIIACIKSGRYYELFPEKIRDSIIYVTKDDTTAVIRDWATERTYKEKMFDIDTVGTATVTAKVQYNRLTWLGSTFTPVTKTIVEPQPIKKFSPFVGVGITTMPSVTGQVGVFFEEKYGFSGVYQYNWETKKHIFGTGFLYKF